MDYGEDRRLTSYEVHTLKLEADLRRHRKSKVGKDRYVSAKAAPIVEDAAPPSSVPAACSAPGRYASSFSQPSSPSRDSLMLVLVLVLAVAAASTALGGMCSKPAMNSLYRASASTRQAAADRVVRHL